MAPKRDGTQRPVLSCTRCRKKKIKCDKLMPCSQCRNARETCSGFTTRGSGEIPRSISQYLEEDIAHLEFAVGNMHNTSTATSSSQMYSRSVGSNSSDGAGNDIRFTLPRGSSKEPNSARQLARSRIRACASMKATVCATIPPSSTLLDMSGIRMSLTPSLALIQKPQHEVHQRSTYASPNHSSEICIKQLSSIPPQATKGLVKAYFDQVHPVLPFLHEGTVWDQVNKVLHIIQKSSNSAIVADHSFLIVYLILAIAVTLGNNKNGLGSRRVAFSETLFREGLQHLSNRTAFPSNLAEIQTILLFQYYGTVSPKSVCVWMLSGAAMRAGIELGLHRETPQKTQQLNALALDLRRRIFWTAYATDQQTCAATHRPISLPRNSISASYFSTAADRHITSDGVIYGAPAVKEPAIHWIEFRAIVSSIVEVQFQGKKLADGASLEDWIAAMEERILLWYESKKSVYAWSETLFYIGRVQLHRPSPRTPLPLPERLLICFESACTIVENYQNDKHSEYFCRTWMAAHNTFGAAMCILFCMRYGSGIIASKYNTEQVFEMTKRFTVSLLRISQYWQEASQYATIYERLLSPLMGAFISGTDVSSALTPEQDTELGRLIYPGAFRAAAQPTSVGNPLVQPFLGNEPFEFDPMDLDMSLFDNVDWVNDSLVNANNDVFF